MSINFVVSFVQSFMYYNEILRIENFKSKNFGEDCEKKK